MLPPLLNSLFTPENIFPYITTTMLKSETDQRRLSDLKGCTGEKAVKD